MKTKINKKIQFLSIGIIIVLFLNIIPLKAQAAVSTSAIFSLTNSARTQRGLNTLSMNSLLNQAAQMKAQDMLNKGYFAHTSPEGLNSWYWFRAVGYSYKTAGENLAIDFSDSSRIFNAWMASPSHRDNIIDPDFTEIGIAALTGNFNGSITTVVVQMFGAQYGASKVNSNISKNMKIQTKQPSVADNPQNTINNQEFNITALNDVFNEFRSLINDVSTDFKQIFIKQILLTMLI